MNKINKTLASMITSLLFSGAAFAAPASVTTEAGQLTWSGATPRDDASYQLTLSGPDGLYLRRVFEAGESVAVALSELPSDGQFKSELIVQPIVSDAALQQRRTGQVLPTADEQDAGSMVVNFSLVEGDLPDSDMDEEAPNNGGPAVRAAAITGDQTIYNSACIGMDCATAENYGSDTLRLKENNLRIHFDDSSNSGSFPNNDWRLEANDSDNGGLNRFSIADATAGSTPFTIEAGAGNNALYVDSSGQVGIGNNSPVVETHITDGDSPTIRLEQNGAAGFTPQTWDLVSNEANFFLRNVTNGSRLVFRVLPNAESDQLVLGNGNTGLYTDNPRQDLHIVRSGNATIGLESVAAGDPDWTIGNNGATDRFEISDTTDGNVNEDLDGAEFSLDASGNLTIAGLLIQNSNVHAKHRITELDPVEILAKLRQMPIHQWQYKAIEGDHIGPMAQDFHATFGLGNTDEKIAGLDVAGVALVAIQGLTAELDQRDQQIAALEQQLAALQTQTEQQQQQLAGLQAVDARLARMERLMSGQQTQTVSTRTRMTHDVEQDLLD